MVLIKHNFVALWPEGADPTEIRTSNWNEAHVLTQSWGKLLGRTSTGTGATEEISPDATLTFSSGSLGVKVTGGYSPLWYGAAGDGSSHPLSSLFSTIDDARVVYPQAVSLSDETDWAVLQKMLSSGFPIDVGKGNYVLNRQLTSSGIAVTIDGLGPDTSKFTWPATATSRGLSITHNGPFQHVWIRGISLVNGELTGATPPTGTALSITNTVGTTTTLPDDPWSNQRCTIENVIIRGTDFATSGWLVGVDYYKPIQVVMTNVIFAGGVGAGSNLRTGLANGSAYAFKFRSDGTGVSCCVRMNVCPVYWANTAIYSNTNFESLEVTKSDFVNVNNGCDISGTTFPSQFAFRDCHSNALVRGFKFNGVAYPMIDNCLVFKQSLADTAMIGVEFTNCISPTVRSTGFYKAGATNFTNVYLGTGTVNASVTDNRHTGDVGTLVDAGVTGIISKNHPRDVVAQFAGSLATVLVEGMEGTTANWNAQGSHILGTEKYSFGDGGDTTKHGMVIDGGPGTPFAHNQTNDGDSHVFYKAFSAQFIMGLHGGGLQIGRSADLLSFYGGTPAVKPTVTGVRNGVAGLTSMLTQMAGLGLITDSTTAGNTVVTADQIDTDVALTANSDTRVPSQKAIKAYADQIIAAADAMVFKGVIDCSGNPNYPAADRGATYKVSVAGKIGGASGVNVEVGDTLMCLTDGTASGTQAGVGSAWNIVQANLDGAVIGPASSTSARIATFNGTTGKLIQDGGSTISDVLSRTNHTGTQAAATITGLAAVATSGAKSDVGLSNVPNTDATNASNLSSGNIPAARMAQIYGSYTRGSNQSLAVSATPSKYLLDTANTAAAGITFGSNQFTVVTAGKYRIQGQIYLSGGGALGDLIQIYVYVNGAARLEFSTNAGGSNDVTLGVTGLVSLAASDVVDLRAAKITGSATTLLGLSGGTQLSFLDISYVGP